MPSPMRSPESGFACVDDTPSTRHSLVNVEDAASHGEGEEARERRQDHGQQDAEEVRRRVASYFKLVRDDRVRFRTTRVEACGNQPVCRVHPTILH